jgi:hypothetical protein
MLRLADMFIQTSLVLCAWEFLRYADSHVNAVKKEVLTRSSGVLRPLLAVTDPLVHHRLVSDPQSHLEWLRVHRQTVRHLVATKAVQDRAILGLFRRQDLKRDNASEEGCVQFAVREMGANAPIVIKSAAILHVFAIDSLLTCGCQRLERNAAFLA